MKRTTSSFSELKENFDILPWQELRRIIGGVAQWEYAHDPAGNIYWRVVGDDTWTSFSALEEVQVSGPSSKPDGFSYESAYLINVGSVGGGSGGSGSGSSNAVYGTNLSSKPGFGYPPAGSTITDELSIGEIAALAISSALAYDEFHMTLDAARLGKIAYDTNSILKNVLDTNPIKTMVKEFSESSTIALKGIAIVGAAGKLLGFTSAISSLITLQKDIEDGNGVSMVNVADVAINVGSIMVKSNIVGATISFGWLIVKGQFEVAK